MPRTSPTQRTLAWLREQPGFRRCQIVEQWVSFPRKKEDGIGTDDKRHGATGIRRDLWGFVDVLAIVQRQPPLFAVATWSSSTMETTMHNPPILDGLQTWAIQTTSGTNVSSRIAKIREECRDAAIDCLDAGWRLWVIGWRKLKPRGQKRATWEPRVVEITRQDLAEPSAPLGS